MSIFVSILLCRIMGCHGNHEISYNQNAIIFRTIILLHLSGPIEQLYTHNKMSFELNLVSFTPLNTSLPNVFHSFLSFHQYS